MINQDARSLRKLMNRPIEENLEAIVCSSSLNNVINFYHCSDGYVSLDDWKEINAQEILKSIEKSNEEDNKWRKKNGFNQHRLIGWIKEPSLNRETHTVLWAVEFKEVAPDSKIKLNKIVTSYVLKLSRKGYETIVWTTSKSFHRALENHLEVMLESHKFDPGFRYEDHVSGDKIAGYGIATPVTTSVGGK